MKTKLGFISVLLLTSSLLLGACSAAPSTTNSPLPTPTTPTRQTIATPLPLLPTTAPSPLRGEIFYETSGERGGQIFAINLNKSRPIKITDGENPLLSPDGKQLAFIVRASNPMREPDFIYTANLDGSNRQLRCTGDAVERLTLLSWSPRDSFIAYNTIPVEGAAFGSRIRLCNPATKNAGANIKMTQGSAWDLWDWTADGENAVWQVYQSKDGATIEDSKVGQSSPGTWGIYYGNPSKGGNGAVLISRSPEVVVRNTPNHYFIYARFSPDSKTIAISSYDEISSKGKLSFMSVPGQKSLLEGKTIDNLSSVSIKSLAWSPDSQSLAYVDDNYAIKLLDVSSQFGKITPLIGTDVRSTLAWSL